MLLKIHFVAIPPKNGGISVIKLTFSNYCINKAIPYRRQLSTISALYSNLELFSNSSETKRNMLGDFNLQILNYLNKSVIQFGNSRSEPRIKLYRTISGIKRSKI